MSFLPEFRIETFFSKYEFSVRHLLGASDIESMPLLELLELSTDEDRTAYDELNLGYIETLGTARLREAIAGTYDDIEPEDIICFCGAEEGILAGMHAALDRDSHAIVVTPNYQSAETVPRSICETTGVPLDEADDWNLDLGRIESALVPGTRLIYVNFPHNPTGKLVSQETYRDLVEIARRQGAYLFSDEVYRMMERDPAQRLPQAADLYERGLSLGVTSKSYGFAGLRVGWIACRDRDLLARMERVKHYTSICNAAPSEMLATMVLKARDQILARNRALVEKNLVLLDGFLEEHAELFDWYRPDGGCIGFPRYEGDEGIEEFAKRLLEQAGVLVVPSSIFESELNPALANRFRIGFGRKTFPEGLAALKGYLAQR